RSPLGALGHEQHLATGLDLAVVAQHHVAETPGHDEVDAPADRCTYAEGQHAAEGYATALGAVLRQYGGAELGVDLLQHGATHVTIELRCRDLRAYPLPGLASR